MGKVSQTYKIKAPLSKVWPAFVDPKIVAKWGGGPAKMSDQEGFEFSLWGGEIYGKNTKVVKDKLLKQDWYSGKDWPSPSKVIFEFSEKNSVTTVKLSHSDIPDGEVDDIDQGWRDYYLNPIKDLIEK